MPKVNVYDMAGKSVGEIELSESVFGIKPNPTVVHQVIVNYLANQRQGTQSTLTRTEVRGGGRKPWKQKGTGHARQGSIRAPQWKHGGVALGPKPRSYSYTLNKKVKVVAVKSALSAKVMDNSFIVVQGLAATEYKTKNIVAMLKALEASRKAMIVTVAPDKMLIRSAGNIPGVKTAVVGAMSVYDILNANKLILSTEAVDMLEEVYA